METARPRPVVAWLLVLAVLAVVVFASGEQPSDRTRAAYDQAEYDAVRERFGFRFADRVASVRERWNGLLAEVIPRPAAWDSGGDGLLTEFGLARDLGRALERWWRQATFRLALLFHLLPPLGAVAAAGLWEGLMRHRARQRGFAYASPLIHRIGARMLAGSCIVLCTVVALPTYMPPWLLPLAGVLPAVALRMFVSNLPKRV